jgi:hypothetical protein
MLDMEINEALCYFHLMCVVGELAVIWKIIILVSNQLHIGGQDS